MRRTLPGTKKIREKILKPTLFWSESLALQYEVCSTLRLGLFIPQWVLEFDLFNRCFDNFSSLLGKAYIFQQHYFFGSSIKSACLV